MNIPINRHCTSGRTQKESWTIRSRFYFLCVIACVFWFMPFSVQAGELPTISIGDSLPMPENVSNLNESSVWIMGVGKGFRSGTHNVGVSAGVTYGVLIFGGEERHHLSLLSASYGQMISGVKGADSWYRGNWELRGEILGGMQFNSETSWLLGITPHVRYHFSTGAPWVPYADFGLGITATEIREPDLGGSFQFNLQAIIGVNYFVRDNLAVNLEGRYIHLSSAGFFEPNNGVNSIGIFLGVNTFF